MIPFLKKTAASGSPEPAAKPPSPAQLRKIKSRNRAIVRAVIQAAFFATMPGAFVAGFNGIKYVFRQVGAGGVLTSNNFVMALAGLGVFTILFGRFFCGYACAFGTLGDLVYWLSGLFQKHILKKKKQISFPPGALPALQSLKYLNLAFIVLMTASGLISMLKGTSAWDVFSLLTAGKLPDISFLPGILRFLAVLVGMAFQARFFCQFLCPMGAFFAILPVLPASSLRRDPGNCVKGCNACKNQCPVGIKLEPDGIRNGECISCARCTGICPKDNLAYPAMALFKKEILYVLFRAALLFALGAWLGLCRFF